MSSFPPVGPRGRAVADYPTADSLDRTVILDRLPVRWAGRLALAAALLSLTGCQAMARLFGHESTPGETGADTAVHDTGGLDGMIGEEFWYHVTEDEAWAVVEQALHDRGYETLREVRTTVDAEGQVHLEARVLDKEGEEVLVGFREGLVEAFRDDGVNTTHAQSCAVLPAEDGSCTVVSCGDEAEAAAEAACATLGAFPWGDYLSYNPSPEHDWVLESSVDRFLTWARERGLVE